MDVVGLQQRQTEILPENVGNLSLHRGRSTEEEGPEPELALQL